MNQQDFFRNVTLCVSRRLDATQMLEDLFSLLRTQMPCDLIQLSYIDEDIGELRSLALVEWRNGQRISHKSRTLFSFPKDAIEILRKGPPGGRRPPPVVVIRAGEKPRRPKQPHPALEEGFKRFRLEGYNLMIVDLHIETQHLGALFIAARPPADFTDEQARMMRDVIDPLAIAFSNARRYEDLLRLKEHLADENKALSQDLNAASDAVLVGEFGGLSHVMSLVRRVAPLASPVLLLGETGTGKEVLAHVIHAMSPRRDKPFVRVQCGAIPEALLDSELFGHEKGAFTGATALRYGRFECARQGTIFLDEIGELTPEAQIKLLRVLQEKEFERVGGTETLHADVRIIAATHRDLLERVRAGQFREDLLFRLNVFPLTLPPLRQRREDIPQLVVHLVNKKCRELNLPSPPPLDAETLRQLQAYGWPGNVRELQNVVERALITSGQGPLRFPDLGVPSIDGAVGGAPLPPRSDPTTLSVIEAGHIRRIMRAARGKIQGPGGAAERLGLQPNTLRARMRKLGIPFGRNAASWDETAIPEAAPTPSDAS
jgi:transcriptional regulator with GAF, ATPase, and Fis domain